MKMPTHPIQILRCMRGSLVSLACLSLLAVSVNVQAQVVTESPEVVYSGSDAQPLLDKATQLGTAVAIYEYVHNTIEHSPYHGSRSGSVNTFLGQRGSDVDIATALIAMLRSQNIPARYAVGTVRIPAAQLTNWLGIPQLDTAVEVLKSQGIQGVTLAADRSTVDLEHAWAEAFVPFDQYRGIDTVSPAIDCSQAASASRCTWVALDASFKQKTYNNLNLDPYDAVSFDYTAYYNAIKNDDAARRDKNPLTILEDQIGEWLRTNHSGMTLEDVEDAGTIMELREGLLPASLPYQVVGGIRRYDTVATHDATVPGTEPEKWGKTLQVRVSFIVPTSGGGNIELSSSAPPTLLAELATKRLTLTTEFVGASNTPNMVIRLGGVEVARPISGVGTIGGYIPYIGDPFTMTVSMDGAPGVSGGADRNITATYSGIIGGYYLLATGGESSNWSQVHRAADQLLAANAQYKIVFNPGEAACQADGVNCTPYVDANDNGWDASDTVLLEDKPALDALTGGLLYVGATQYYAKMLEQFDRADRVMKTRTPVIGFLGVVSSVYEAEYIDGTAFSILPGGLLIDMKGITTGGSYRTNESAVTYSNRQFEFLAHIGSSLEHEIWQEITGYDAVSTVRGIQMALANGASLLNPKKIASSDTLPGLYPSFGFSTTAPPGFNYTPLTVYSTAPSTWTHSTSGSAFDTFLSTVDTGTGATQKLLATYSYSPSTGLYAWSECADYWEGQLQAFYNANGNISISPIDLCNQTFSGPVLTVISQFQSYWNNTIIPSQIGQTYFDYFDRNKGFTTTGRVYRTTPAANDAHDTLTVVSIRNDLNLRDIAQSWIEYLIPSKLTTGATYRFSVMIRKRYDAASNDLVSMSMEIANRSLSAGGGYVGLPGAAAAADNTKQGN
ncbi:transglutaminase-like domain-containing protein [Denitromonas iodatirespirans]|uniref:Transglutaminase domain-containing protein n=1 Tax=Denitromonas iodatirespirans TaxID=2795389 RepID=A0A944D836_DENI1|nr:transglutaminase-like domain-containing protein [Denitromonas iodatirespirans]MBT0960256.1 transglutaminase domain-containing protein [Denitromonas iodatirespirans]